MPMDLSKPHAKPYRVGPSVNLAEGSSVPIREHPVYDADGWFIDGFGERALAERKCAEWNAEPPRMSWLTRLRKPTGPRERVTL